MKALRTVLAMLITIVLNQIIMFLVSLCIDSVGITNPNRAATALFIVSSVPMAVTTLLVAKWQTQERLWQGLRTGATLATALSVYSLAIGLANGTCDVMFGNPAFYLMILGTMVGPVFYVWMHSRGCRQYKRSRRPRGF